MSNNNERRIGNYISKIVAGEAVKIYIPPKMEYMSVDLESLHGHIDKATQALGALNSITNTIPNPSLFIYMYVRKEALISSQIEGTQSSFSDLVLFDSEQKTNISIDDIEEVSNYIAATNFALKKLKSGFPLCLRLFKDTHKILLRGGRGSKKTPGEFRETQNWIGGTRPGNALFVPPSPDDLPDILRDLEKFLNNEGLKLPEIIKVGLAHVQFESIHPFLDGNGRLGRLLITLMLVNSGLLNEPALYLSLFFKKNRALYYDLLQQVRDNNAWEAWLEFFLEGVIFTAKEAYKTILEMNNLFEVDAARINNEKRSANIIAAFEYLKNVPQVSVPQLAKSIEVSAPTARSILNKLLELNIVEEVSGKQRDREYIYKRYLDILEQGTEPLR